MVMVPLRLRTLALHVLLDGGEILLRGRNISRLQILPQLFEGLFQGIAAGGRRRRTGVRANLLQSRKIALRRRQVAGLKILSQLLKLLLELLHVVLNALVFVAEQIAAGNA